MSQDPPLTARQLAHIARAFDSYVGQITRVDRQAKNGQHSPAEVVRIRKRLRDNLIERLREI